MNTVALPREMVMRLLHQAQHGDGAGLILRHPDGEFGLKKIAGDMHPQELERELAAKSDTAFAFYRTAAQGGPDAGDLHRWSRLTPLFLSVSVGTKGVLQLRAWRAQGGNAEPVELLLAEESAAQNSGVSR